MLLNGLELWNMENLELAQLELALKQTCRIILTLHPHMHNTVYYCHSRWTQIKFFFCVLSFQTPVTRSILALMFAFVFLLQTGKQLVITFMDVVLLMLIAITLKIKN